MGRHGGPPLYCLLYCTAIVDGRLVHVLLLAWIQPLRQAATCMWHLHTCHALCRASHRPPIHRARLYLLLGTVVAVASYCASSSSRCAAEWPAGSADDGACGATICSGCWSLCCARFNQMRARLCGRSGGGAAATQHTAIAVLAMMALLAHGLPADVSTWPRPQCRCHALGLRVRFFRPELFPRICQRCFRAYASISHFHALNSS